MDSLWHVFLAVSLVMALGVCAEPLARRLGVDGSPLERSVVSAGIGLAILAWAASAACLFGFFRPALAWGLWIASMLVVVARRQELRSATSWAWDAVRMKWIGVGLAGKVVAILCGALALAALVMALAPPDDSDAGQYHLGLARLYTVVGGYEHHPTWLRSGFSLNATMLYGVEMLLHPRPSVAMSWVIWILEGAALWVYGNRWFSARAGAFYVPLWLGIGVTYAAVGGYAEGFLTLQWVLALHAFALWLRSGKGGALLLSGLFIGTAAGTKPSGLAALAGWLALAPLATTIWPRVASGTSQRARKLALASILALVAASPWYLRNWIYEKNPVFPALPTVFGSAVLPEVGEKPWEIFPSGPRTRASALAGPFRATFDPPMRSTSTAWAEYTIGPWVLAFLPLFLLARPGGRLSLFLVAWSFVQAWLWCIPSGAVGRHLYPFLQTAGPLAGAVLETSLKGNRRRFLFLAAFTLIALLPVYGLELSRAMLQLPSTLSIASRENYLSLKMPQSYPVIQYTNRHLQPTDRILIVDAGISGALLDVPWRYGFPRFMQVAIDPLDWGSREDFHRKMKSDGFTHVWFRPEIFGPDRAPAKTAYETYLDCCARKLFATETISLYRIEFPKDPA